MRRLFVSYRREDSPYVAEAINERLEQRWGTDSVFFDIDSIPLGSDFRKHISDSVGKCDVLLVIIGNNWATAIDDSGQRRLDDPSDFVRLEVESALGRGIPVIPVLVGNAQIPAPNDLPESLRELSFRNATEVRAGHDLPQHLDRLVKGVESLFQSEQGVCDHEIDAAKHPRVSESTAGVRSPSPIESASPPRQRSAQRRLWKRVTIALLTSLFFFIAGWGAGAAIQRITYSEPAALIGAVTTWIAGVVLTVWVWRRHKRA